jgi:hypothetical protein
MIFLIQYNRALGRIIKQLEFSDSQRQAAENARLELELDLHRRRVADEVVLLEADSEEALRRTHRRYFEDLTQIVESTRGGGG